MSFRTSPMATALLVGLYALASTPTARATETVAPGHTLNFANPESGSRECRTENRVFGACTSSLFIGTGWSVSARRVRALVIKPPPAELNPPSYAKGSLHNTFTVIGTPGHWVNAQISAEYDVDPAQIFLIGAAYSEITVMLEVRDVTHGAGFPMTTHTLYQLRRDNTQGITDVSGSQERQIKPGETGHFDMLLATGRTYELSFTLEAMGGAFLGGTEARGTATWNRLTVSLDEDEVELLDDLAVALQKHDEDIKARLDTVDEKLDTIHRLLQTPQGRRPGWNDR